MSPSSPLSGWCMRGHDSVRYLCPVFLTPDSTSTPLQDNVLDNETVKVDFKPLYTCIHIYDTLDAREELQLSYQADRRVRAYVSLSLGGRLSWSSRRVEGSIKPKTLTLCCVFFSPFPRPKPASSYPRLPPPTTPPSPSRPSRPSSKTLSGFS